MPLFNGLIMANEVIINIPGIGDVVAENAASESTLRSILSAIEAGNRAGGGGSTGSGSSAGSSSNGAAAASSNRFVSAMSMGVAGFNKLTDSIAKVTTSSVQMIDHFANLNGSVVSASYEISDFAKNIPILGKMLGSSITAVARAQDGLIKAYQSSSAAGASFAGSLNVFVANASAANMTLQDYSSFIAANGKSLALLGGTTEDGARRFSVLSKTLRETSTDLYALGYSAKDFNTGLVQYTQNQMYYGNVGKKTNAELVAGTKAYMKELDILAKITGESREKVASDMATINLDTDFRSYIDSLGANSEKAGMELGSTLKSVPDSMQKFLKDVITHGVPTTADTQAAWSVFPEIGRAAMKYKQSLDSGTATAADTQNLLNVVASESAVKNKDATVNLAKWSESGMGFAKKMAMDGVAFDAQRRKKAEDEQNKELKATDDFIKRYEDFKNKIVSTGNSYTNTLARSGVFDMLIKMFDLLSSTIDKVAVPIFNTFGDIVSNVTKDASDWFTPLLKALGDIVDYIPSIITNAFGPIGTYLKTEFTNMFGGIAGDISGLTKKIDFDPKAFAQFISEKIGHGINEGIIGFQKIWNMAEQVVIKVMLLANSFDSIRQTMLMLQVGLDNFLSGKIGRFIFGDEVGDAANAALTSHKEQLATENASIAARAEGRKKTEEELQKKLSDLTGNYDKLTTKLTELNSQVDKNAKEVTPAERTGAPEGQTAEEKEIAGKVAETKVSLQVPKSADETKKIFEQELIKSGITDAKALASYMGIAEGETGGFTSLKEAGRYKSADRIKEVFKSRSDVIARADEIAAMGMEQQYNALYGGEWGKKNLGNIEAGDGYKYRGRGFNQLTGRSNYESIGKLIGADLVNKPDLLLDPKIAAQANIAYNKRNLGSLGATASFEDYLKATGGSHDLWDKKRASYAANLARYQKELPTLISQANAKPVIPEVKPVIPVAKPVTPEVKPVATPAKPIEPVATIATPTLPKIKPIDQTPLSSVADEKKAHDDEARQNKINAAKERERAAITDAENNTGNDATSAKSPLEDKLQIFEEMLQEMRTSNQMASELLNVNHNQLSTQRSLSGNGFVR